MLRSPSHNRAIMLSSAVGISVKRVVTCFILSTTTNRDNKSHPTSSSSSSSASSPSTLFIDNMTRENVKVAVFQRKDTMPTFPSHWAGVSGSIEEGEEPWQTAQRELKEETDLSFDEERPTCSFEKMGGLYLDVPFQKDRKIRVYPFVVRLQQGVQSFHLRGTEHDTYKFISVPELEQLKPTVPGLADAFHYATCGKFLASDALPEEVWTWASDKENGASTLAKNAVPLAKKYPKALSHMTMLRPTMVPIVSVLKAMQHLLDDGQDGDEASKSVLESLDKEVERSIDMGVKTLHEMLQDYEQQCSSDQSAKPFTIATFSRSSTITKILQRFLSQHSQTKAEGRNSRSPDIHILCAKSTPGDEGKLMANDLDAMKVAKVECVEDNAVHQAIRDQKVHIVVVGADCVIQDQVVNKIGTKALSETCQKSSTTIVCCTDRWKVWDDIFPPPLEDIFECVPKSLFHRVVIPPSPPAGQEDSSTYSKA